MNFIFLVASLVVCTSIFLVVDAGVTIGLWNFANTLSGYYINSRQIQIEENFKEIKEGRHDLISALYLPVEIPWLFPAIPFYLEELINHNVYRMLILAVREVNGVFRIDQYNITTTRSYRPGEFQKTDFANISLEPLNKQCEIELLTIEPDMYSGTFPDCKRFIGSIQQYPSIALTLTCHKISAMIYYDISEESKSLLPYVVDRKKWFELPPSVTKGVNFSLPCNNQLNQVN